MQIYTAMVVNMVWNDWSFCIVEYILLPIYGNKNYTGIQADSEGSKTYGEEIFKANIAKL